VLLVQEASKAQARLNPGPQQCVATCADLAPRWAGPTDHPPLTVQTALLVLRLGLASKGSPLLGRHP
jgi:hypothetical protein